MPTIPTERKSSLRTDVVGIRFEKLGKLYHFRVGSLKVNLEDYVVVETQKGRQLGQVITFVDAQDSGKRSLRTIIRLATPRDLVLQQIWESRNLDALIKCREQSFKLGVSNAKFVKAQYNYDGSWVTISYVAEERHSRLNELRDSMTELLRSRVEMQLIGPRDLARILGGYGACGGPRCCSTFLTDFSPVSIRMAKEQGIPLSPSEITGMCGRLRCCLVYEYEMYVEAKKRLPALRSKIGTPYGEGIVRDVRLLRDSVIVELANGEHQELFRSELEPLDELSRLKDKAAAGCTKHEGGGCDCGAKKGDSAESASSAIDNNSDENDDPDAITLD